MENDLTQTQIPQLNSVNLIFLVFKNLFIIPCALLPKQLHLSLQL